MQVAFLFEAQVSAEEMEAQVLSRLAPDERRSLKTYIRCGSWDIDSVHGTKPWANPKQRADTVRQTLLTGEGNLYQWSRSDVLSALTQEEIYTVQFESLKPALALRLHERLRNIDIYLGFTQVLPQLGLHQRVFSNCPPKWIIDGGKTLLLFSSFRDDEHYADATLGWIKKKYAASNSDFALSLDKRDVGARFSIFDQGETAKSNMEIHRSIRYLRDEWEDYAERTIFMLRDIDFEAMNELLNAVTAVAKPDLAAADCAQVAVSLRRCIEKVTEVYCPGDDTKPGWVNRRWIAFMDKQKDYIKNYLSGELSSLNSALGRLEQTVKMTNKGVHEDVEPEMLPIITIRTIVLLHDLVKTRKATRPRVYYEPGIFEDE